MISEWLHRNGLSEQERQRTSSTTCDEGNDSLVSPAYGKVLDWCMRHNVGGVSEPPPKGSRPASGGSLTSQASLTSQWDADYIRWLSDPDITLGKALRLEIAQRLRELSGS